MNSMTIMLYMFKRLFSDKKGWFIYLLIPTVIMSLIVHFSGNDEQPLITIAYTNEDNGELGSFLIENLQEDTSLRLVEMDSTSLKEAIVNRSVSVGFVIPADFSSQLLDSTMLNPLIQTYYLAISNTSVHVEFLLEQSTLSVSQTIDMLETVNHSKEDILTELATILNQQKESAIEMKVSDLQLKMNNELFLVIGFILYFVMNLTIHSIGLVLEDRKERTMARMYSAPVSTLQISFGYFCGSFGLGFTQILFVLCITKYLLGYDYGISLPYLLLIFSAFLFSVVGIGSALASLVHNTQALGSTSSLVVVPTTMIGGCWWPITIMPDFMQKIANFVPQRWVIDGIERLAAGESLTQISLHLGILLLFGIVLLGFGSVILRPNEEAV